MDNRNYSNGYIDPGFISTSHDINIALNFAKGFDDNYTSNYPSGTTLFVITSIKNLNCIYLKDEYTSYYKESEILFCAPVKYIILADNNNVNYKRNGGSVNLDNFRNKMQTIVDNICPRAKYGITGISGGIKVVLVALVGIGTSATNTAIDFHEHKDPTGIYEDYNVSNTQEKIKELQQECLIKAESDPNVAKLLTL